MRKKASETPALRDDANFDEKDAAAILLVSPRALQRGRQTGDGPPFCRIGNPSRGRIIYTGADLRAYIESRRVRSTSESIRKMEPRR